MLMSSDEESSNSDDSSEDEPYKPVRKDSSSDSCAADPVPSCKVKGKKKTSNKSDSQDKGKGKNKMKEKICVDDDAYVEGIPCVHACAAIARVNKWPEDFCHKLLTMESYKATYSHHINPLPGQQLWERSEANRPLAPLVKRKPGQLQTKRRKDADERGA
ncbi:hypothetical protein Ahy_B02g060821 [Arachis hypogaea]|uniref:Zinc finger PMZ-type domain-containing protein n=1 Tax=Arachis hypogaea TaxID=3818 RepID=A0A445AJE3_ARAHY|nr:hypothetical protein Ahy_B02g060821 [Arachis hypogaea]